MPMSKYSATTMPPAGSISEVARDSCQLREASGSWLSSVDTRPQNANGIWGCMAVVIVAVVPWAVVRCGSADVQGCGGYGGGAGRSRSFWCRRAMALR